MPARKKRIAEGPGGGLLVQLNKNHRKRVEAAYQNKLPDSAWLQVKRVTSLCTVISSGETTAAPVKQVLGKLKELQDAAISVKTEIWKIPLDQDSKPRALSVKQLTEREMFSILCDTIGVVIEVTRFVSEALNRGGGQGHAKGHMWNHWVRELTEIMKRNKLPFHVRKDTDKRADNRQSDFVRLIDSLQNELPKDFRQCTQSLDALAQGISRARRRSSNSASKAGRQFWTPASMFRGVQVVDYDSDESRDKQNRDASDR